MSLAVALPVRRPHSLSKLQSLLYHCGCLTSKRNEDFLAFNLPLSPMCAGHISLFEKVGKSNRMHVTLDKINVKGTILVQTRYPSRLPVCWTFL